MRRFWLNLSRFSILLFALYSQQVVALGTSAGTTISSSARVDYAISGVSSSSVSTPIVFRVDETIDLNVSWQDGASIPATSPHTSQVLSFLLTNTGNGNDSYSLSVQNNLTGDQFDPLLVNIYLDANANGLFDAATDTLYLPGVNDPLLAADTSLAVFVLNDIPAALAGGDLGNSLLVASSNTITGTPSTSLAGAGDNSTTAVVGDSGGTSSDTGTYLISDSGSTVSLLKSVVINDPLGGNQPMPGAVLTYRIDVSVSGTGNANGLVITDPIPANTTYLPGSLRLNTTPLTDALDADSGDVGGTTANTVTVNLGDVSPSSATQTIYFDVTIN